MESEGLEWIRVHFVHRQGAVRWAMTVCPPTLAVVNVRHAKTSNVSEPSE
jgi:hypothetical protein